MAHSPAAVGILAALAFVAAVFLTRRIRRLAHAHNFLDVPNSRSSHYTPTARGGGLAFVIVILAVICLSGLVNWLTPLWAVGLLGAGGALAIVGWIDDRGHVAAPIRLMIHAGAAIGVTATLGPLSLDWAGSWPPAVEWFTTILLIVWIINLVNFMDGIDGLAASESCFVLFGFALCLAAAGDWQGSGALALVAGASVAGFLLLNWPPASIFMGDVGSGFLGGLLGGILLLADRIGLEFTAAIGILFAVFVTDATVTVLRRLLQGRPIWAAHRSHAYQRLARRWSSHLTVTYLALGVNLAFLLPLALAVSLDRVPGWLGLALAYIPLVMFAISAGAGCEDDKEKSD